jgi:hypothetical protein
LEGFNSMPKEMDIYIYALKTDNTHMTEEGFGYSTPPEDPLQHTISFYWEMCAEETPGDYARLRGATSSVRDTAQNLSRNYLDSFDGKYPVDQYAPKIHFCPSPSTRREPELLRGLTFKEQETFWAAFRQANLTRAARELGSEKKWARVLSNLFSFGRRSHETDAVESAELHGDKHAPAAGVFPDEPSRP